jgi:LysM repeat protein
MRLRWGHILPLVLLLLSACTRQAEGPFEPVGNPPTDVAAVATSILTEEAVFTPQDSTEVITEEAEVTDVTVLPTEEAPLIFTLEPTETATPEMIVLETDAPAAESATPEFITPDSPSELMGGNETPEVGGEPTEVIPTEAGDEMGSATGDDNLTEVDEDCIYTVQRGDTLFRIAIAQDTTIAELREANEEIATTDTIFPGQELIIPNCDDQDQTPDDEDDPTPTTAAPVGSITHTVRAGESLYIIAQRYGVTIQAIVDANELVDPNKLQVGQVLIIPQE